MQFADSHAHLTDAAVLPLLPALLERAKQARVTRLLNICTDQESLQEGLYLAATDLSVRNAGATTPHDVDLLGEKEFALFAEAARSKKLCAVGETGLDYHNATSSKIKQKEFLIRYLHLAAECHLPLIFHCRDAFCDLFPIADAENVQNAVLHCFTGTMQEAEEVIKRGWYLSLSGIVTFKKSDALREVAKEIPLSQLLLETDTPYLAPQSKRGKVNEPSFLPEIAACVAEVKKVSVEEVALATWQNTNKIFGFAF